MHVGAESGHATVETPLQVLLYPPITDAPKVDDIRIGVDVAKQIDAATMEDNEKYITPRINRLQSG